MEDIGSPQRVRILRVSRQLLADVLLLPEGTRIVGVSDQMYFDSDCIALKVEHQDFSPVQSPDRIPEVRPQWRTKQVPVFDGWGE